MKISSLQENLKNGMSIVNHIAGKNMNLPILNNILIKAKNGNIDLVATDLEVGIVCSVRGKIEKEGEFTVDSKIISDYISLLPNKKINIINEKNNLTIESENYNTVIRGMSAEDFPLIPQINKKTFFKTDIEIFREALSQVIYAVSTSETRVELSGVLFDFNNKGLTLAATDSYRLCEKKIKVEKKTINDSEKNKEENIKIIVPAKTLQELIRILAVIKSENFDESERNIKFYISENQILFVMGKTELISRLVEGSYPDYQQIIPTKYETKAIINRGEFLRAVKAAAIFSKTNVNDINLDLPANKNKLIISSASNNTGENITELDSQVEGKDNGIVINYRYLLDGINNIKSENIMIKIINGNTPCIIMPEGDESYLYVIMPIKQ